MFVKLYDIVWQAWAGLTAQVIKDWKWDIRSYVDGAGLLAMNNDKK